MNRISLFFWFARVCTPRNTFSFSPFCVSFLLFAVSLPAAFFLIVKRKPQQQRERIRRANRVWPKIRSNNKTKQKEEREQKYMQKITIRFRILSQTHIHTCMYSATTGSLYVSAKEEAKIKQPMGQFLIVEKKTLDRTFFFSYFLSLSHWHRHSQLKTRVHLFLCQSVSRNVSTENIRKNRYSYVPFSNRTSLFYESHSWLLEMKRSKKNKQTLK